jgi:hypothetical protein
MREVSFNRERLAKELTKGRVRGTEEMMPSDAKRVLN